MLKNLKGYFYPRNLPEALGILQAYAPKAAIIAGGTHIARSSTPSIEYLVDITRLGLDDIGQDRNHLRIGAACTFQQLIDSLEINRFAGGLLTRAAAAVSTQLIRNAGTVGGAIVQALPYNDVPVALLALDATVVIKQAGARDRNLSLDELLAEHPRHTLAPADLITEIRLPLACARWSSHYRKFARTWSEWEALAQVAVGLQRQDGTCRQARIALGALTRRAMRFPEAEAVLQGKVFTPELCRQAAQAVFEHLTPTADSRASKEYRRELGWVLVQRAVQQAWDQEGN